MTAEQDSLEFQHAVNQFQEAFPIGSQFVGALSEFEIPLGRDYLPQDVETILKTLAAHKIDIVKFSELALKAYKIAGSPKSSDQLDPIRQTTGSTWISLLSTAKEFTATAVRLERIQKSEIIRHEEVDRDPKTKVLSERDQSRPFDERLGIQDNNLITIGGYYQESATWWDLRDQARRVIELGNRRGEDRTATIDYLQQKLALEKEFLLYTISQAEKQLQTGK